MAIEKDINMSLTPPTIGEVLKTIRTKRHHLTLKDAARLTGVPPAYLWQLESGRKKPRVKMVYKLAQGYDVPAQLLLYHAGYVDHTVVKRAMAETIKHKVLLEEYERLSDEGKKMLESYLQFLRDKERGRLPANYLDPEVLFQKEAHKMVKRQSKKFEERRVTFTPLSHFDDRRRGKTEPEKR